MEQEEKTATETAEEKTYSDGHGECSSPATKELIELELVRPSVEIPFQEVFFKKKKSLKKYLCPYERDNIFGLAIGIFGLVVLGVLYYFLSWSLWIIVPLTLLHVFFTFVSIGPREFREVQKPHLVVKDLENLLQFEFDDDFRYFHGGFRLEREEILLLSDSDCSKLKRCIQRVGTPLIEIESGVYQQLKEDKEALIADRITLDLNRKAIIYYHFIM